MQREICLMSIRYPAALPVSGAQPRCKGWLGTGRATFPVPIPQPQMLAAGAWGGGSGTMSFPGSPSPHLLLTDSSGSG